MAIITKESLRAEFGSLLVQIIETFLGAQEDSEAYKNTSAILSQLFTSVYDTIQNRWFTSKDLNVK